MKFLKPIQNDLIIQVINYINKLIQVNRELQSSYKIINDKESGNKLTFKIRSYNKWIIILEEIKNSQSQNNLSIELFKEKKLSDKCIKKIIEINDTNKLQDLETLSQTLKEIKNKIKDDHIQNKTLKSKSKGNQIKNISYESAVLQKVYGIGEKTVNIFLEKGITVSKLIEEWDNFKTKYNDLLMPIDYFDNCSSERVDNFNNEKKQYIKNKFSETNYLKYLNYGQLVGIKYFNDIEQRIPRDEIDIINKMLKKCLKKMNKDLKMDVCGSYRRGKENSGDIDVLICHPLIKEKEDLECLNDNILLKLVMFLSKAGFLTEHLTIKGNTKYMGLCRLKGYQYHRRIDILFKPYNCYASSLLYFTGSGDLNKIMREHAIRKSMKLNEYGLFKMKFNKSKNQLEEDYRIECQTEKDIFEKLEMDYKTPKNRNI